MRNRQLDLILNVGFALLSRTVIVDSFPVLSIIGLQHLHRDCHPTLTLYGSKQREEADDDDDDDVDNFHQDWKSACFPIHVIASPQVLLPGEQITLSLMDEDTIILIQDIVLQEVEMENQQDSRSSSASASASWGGAALLAMAVQLEDSTVHYNEDWTMAQVASLCEIVGFTTMDSHVQLDLKCIGRVRLERMLRSYSSTHFQFTGEHISESLNHQKHDSYEKAQRLEKNINHLMTQISKREQELNQLKDEGAIISSSINIRDSESTTISSIEERYLQSREKIMQVIRGDPAIQNSWDEPLQSTDSNDSEILRLTATSWAVFLSLHDEKLEARYRLRALDWDDLLERLKLGQYALREKQLLMQGLLLETQSTSFDHSTRKDLDDAFQ